MARSSISAFIICHDEEASIRRALESIAWCNEIVIVDSGSKDNTLHICEAYTQKIYHRSWQGFVAQKAFGLSQCHSTWVLNIDADEEVSPELRKQMEEILEADANKAIPQVGFEIPRVVFFLGRWWRNAGWGKEYRLRLVKRANTVWGGSDPHEHASVNGSTAKLQGELHHFTYSDLSEAVNSLNRHSLRAALTLFERKTRPSIFSLIFHPLGRFFKFFILKRGFLEGQAGFIVAIFEAFYVFMKYSKLWERNHNKD